MVRQKFTINPSKTIDNHRSDGHVLVCLKNFIKQLTSCKSVDQLQAEAESNNELKRTLTSFQLLALGVGSIIGKQDCSR
jgi:hypothetical protein